MAFIRHPNLYIFDYYAGALQYPIDNINSYIKVITENRKLAIYLNKLVKRNLFDMNGLSTAG